MNSHLYRLASLFLSAVLLSGCITVPFTPLPEPWSAEHYYDAARQAQASGDYSDALKQLADLKQRHPENPYARLVAIESSYAHYQSGNYLAAIHSADQHIAEQPDTSSLDYAWYLKGIAHLKLTHQNGHFDANNSRAAYQSFATLAQTFPASQYRNEALQPLQPLRLQLADHELETIQALLQQGNQSGARERAAYLAKNYPDTAAANAALIILHSDNHNKTVSQQHTTWLLQQAPDHYTLQMAGTSDQERLETLIARAPEQLIWFQRPAQRRLWYTLLYGHYGSAAEAEAAIPALKALFAIDEAWVQPFAALQKNLLNADDGH